MAKSKPAVETPPAADEVVARGADVPLALAASTGPRDALVDPRDGDYVPDNDSKGYHVGQERQPAEPVLTAGGDVRFESTADQPSKFEVEPGKSLIDVLKAAHNEADSKADSTEHVEIVTTREEALGLTSDDSAADDSTGDGEK